jgi:uncharacterized protein (DUF924 family)
MTDIAPCRTPADVIGLWTEAGPDKWFDGGPEFDALCQTRLESLHFAAARRELDGWLADAQGALALILLTDQIPRNIWRGTGHAYATDPLARRFAAYAVDRGFDRAVEFELRRFFYLPFQHSERLADQARAVRLFEGLGDPTSMKWALHHHRIVERFGRFPHRNAALGRDTTSEEAAFLEADGFRG